MYARKVKINFERERHIHRDGEGGGLYVNNPKNHHIY